MECKHASSSDFHEECRIVLPLIIRLPFMTSVGVNGFTGARIDGPHPSPIGKGEHTLANACLNSITITGGETFVTVCPGRGVLTHAVIFVIGDVVAPCANSTS